MSEKTPAVDQVVQITVTVIRNETTYTEKDWVKGGTVETADRREDGTQYGYTPQVLQIKKIERTLLITQIKELDLPELTRAILEHSKPLI